MHWNPLRRTDPHTLAGAYALDALGPADRARFGQHLATCPACRQETQGLHEATAMLAATAVTAPPDGLRDRVLAAAAQTRQSPPLPRAAGLGWPRWAARPGLRLAVAGSAAAVALALVFGGLAYHEQAQLRQEQSRTRAVAAVLGAPDSVMMTALAADGGSATVVMSHHMRELVFTAARLPALPAAQRYELWLMSGGRARPAGMLPPQRGGVTAPVVVSGLRPGDMVALTVEPSAGSSRPTTPMVMHLALPS
jgi:anti-sigma-K factor RskA